MTDLMAEVREALGRLGGCPDPECLVCAHDRDLLARLDGMTIVPAGEVERLRRIEEAARAVGGSWYATAITTDWGRGTGPLAKDPAWRASVDYAPLAALRAALGEEAGRGDD